MIRTRIRRPLLALALLPAAAGVALGSVAASASSSHPEDRPSVHAQSIRHTSPATERSDDHGGARTAPRPVEPGDDSGGHGGRTTATRTPEKGDDHGRHAEPGDDSGHHRGSDDGPHHS